MTRDGEPRRPTQVGLVAQVRRHLLPYAAGALCLLTFQALLAARDRLFKSGVDSALARDTSATTRIALLTLAVVVAAAVIRVGSRMTIFHAGRMSEYELRAAVLERIHGLGTAFFRRMPVGEVMSRATNDLGQVRLLLGFGALNVLNTVFALVSALSVMLSISGSLTAAALVPFPFVLLVTSVFSTALYKRNKQNQDSIGDMSRRVQQSLAGVRVVRSFCLEAAEQASFEEASHDYLLKSLALARLRGLMFPIMVAIAAIGNLIVFWYGGSLVLHDRISPGAFVAFWAALARLTWPIMALGLVTSIVQRGRAGYARLLDIFNAIPDVTDGPGVPPDRIDGALEVRNLAFSYGSRRVLEDVSFRVDAGRSLAVLGRVGSGKSTLIQLLARLQPTPRGSVFLDGVDVCDLPLRTVRAAIGLASQDAFLFSTTVARNIGFALDEPDSPPTLSRIRDAAAEAHVLEEALALPNQLDTIVGERGVQLSGGQRQRVSLARALVYEPAVLVLDDPLSAVDARTEKAILDTIDREIQKRTVVLVTSRIAAAARCDSIVVLDRGHVLERGTHDELLGMGGLYSRFAEEQRLRSEIQTIGAELEASSNGQAQGGDP